MSDETNTNDELRPPQVQPVPPAGATLPQEVQPAPPVGAVLPQAAPLPPEPASVQQPGAVPPQEASAVPAQMPPQQPATAPAPVPEQAPSQQPGAPRKAGWSAGKIVALILSIILVLGVATGVTGVVLYKNYQQKVENEKQAKREAAVAQEKAAEKAREEEIQKNITLFRQDVDNFTSGKGSELAEKAAGGVGSFESFVNGQLTDSWVEIGDHAKGVVDYSNRLADPQEFTTADKIAAIQSDLTGMQTQATDFKTDISGILSEDAIDTELSSSAYDFSADEQDQLKEIAMTCFDYLNKKLAQPEANETTLWQMTSDYLNFLASTKSTWTARSDGLYFTSGRNRDEAERLSKTCYNQLSTTVDSFRALLVAGVPNV